MAAAAFVVGLNNRKERLFRDRRGFEDLRDFEIRERYRLRREDIEHLCDMLEGDLLKPANRSQSIPFLTQMTSLTRHVNQKRSVYRYMLIIPAVLTVCVFSWFSISIKMTSSNPTTIGTLTDQYLLPDDGDLLDLSDIQLLDIFTKYINSFQIMCRNHFRLGVLTDGGKNLCVDNVVTIRSPCLVYSFGVYDEDRERDQEHTSRNGRKSIIHIAPNSNDKFSFEESVIQTFGCEVLTFDPTMGNMAVRDMHIPRGCQFYPKGLDGAEIPSKSLYRMTTLLEEFGHTDRVIDILKLDIEGSEWSAIEDMQSSGVLHNVKHLLVEFHFHSLSKLQKRRALRVFRILYNEGFRAYSRHVNSGKSEYVEQLGYHVAYFVEICYINLRFI